MDARDLARDARALQKAAVRAPSARQEAERLQGEADAALAEAEGGKTRNVHLGGVRKMDTEAARRKARVMTAEDILDILPIPTAIHVREHGFRFEHQQGKLVLPD